MSQTTSRPTRAQRKRVSAGQTRAIPGTLHVQLALFGPHTPIAGDQLRRDLLRWLHLGRDA